MFICKKLKQHIYSNLIYGFVDLNYLYGKINQLKIKHCYFRLLITLKIQNIEKKTQLQAVEKYKKCLFFDIL